MRNIKYIVLHCTASPQTQTVQSILNYWKHDLGWSKPGYHFLITPDGVAHNLVPIEEPSNGVKGFNANSIHFSFIGGVVTTDLVTPEHSKGSPIDNRTPAQRATMQHLVEKYSAMFPAAVIQGHRDFSPDKNRNGIVEPSEWMKTCPSFSAKEWLREIGFKSKLPEQLYVTTAVVNIREGAGVDFKPVVAPLAKGVTVKFISESNNWFYVSAECGGVKVTGWINSNFLSKVS
jgi:N-acetylmuramoyl-L-alanine amidase